MGYTGSILRINLSNGIIKTEPLNEKWAKDYLGGKGLSIKYLYEELEAGVDPLSEDNKLIFMTGPLSGTIVPNSGKMAIAAKSPASGTILDCSIGGAFAPEMKYAGYDAIILEGKATIPAYIYIEDEHVELRSAEGLWGKGAHEAEYALQKELDDAKIVIIGQAGENMVQMSCINSDYYRQAGRGGIGAVMGSKNVKAIAIKGTKGIKTSEIRKFMAWMNKTKREDTLSEDNMWAYTDGTPMIVELGQTTGTLPTFNFQQGTFDGWKSIDSESAKKVRIAKKGCFACALACGNYSKMGNTQVEGPEYETLALGGSNCGISDLEAIIEFNRRCDDYGLDTISAGNVIGFAMELTEKGVKDFGLRFGEVESYLKAVDLIAVREGIGAELAQGVRFLADKYGGKNYAMEVKNLEIPGYEPRGSWSMGLAYATADRGACHMRAWPIALEAFGDLDPYTIEGKAQLVIDLQDHNSAKFSAILCDCWALSEELQAEILGVLLQREYTVEELKKVGERTNNLARLFNEREGFDSKSDTLPERIFTEKLPTGASKGKLLPREEFNKMLAEFYSLRGWDKEGRVTTEKRAELNL